MERLSDPFEDFDVWQDSPNVIARPPWIVFWFLVVGLASGQLVETPALYEPVQYLGGAGLLIGGFALMASAMKSFRSAGTAVETWRSTTKIVDTGPYGSTRNPIYVSMLLIYMGIGVIANAPSVVALAPLLFGVLHFGVVLREEDYLECKFGDRYLAYNQVVPRWG
ncbi:MAG: methyltransferase family protein [Alphaproteobacteria bacterium]